MLKVSMNAKAGNVTNSIRSLPRSFPDGQLPVVRTIWLASLGSALEFYDFVIFAFLAPVIGKLFFAASLAD